MSAKRILVIDDEPNLSALIQACLESFGGWVVFTAGSGREGLLKAQSEQPDAILLDMILPDMDGLTLVRALRNNPTTQAIPVILLTAKVLTGEQEQFDELGIRGAIAKPFDPLTLVAQLAKVLAWQD
ncbi:MAG TPA: two-component system response regulator [Cyanobacteria bacterium UBA11370]|nr:two-component system response regulator [Cyanobacteria bacterium UBA11370]HBY77991.1 two-component system response regulator [Cyanobacteria bacterium UBA11148]